jgi:hypothetical protein
LFGLGQLVLAPINFCQRRVSATQSRRAGDGLLKQGRGLVQFSLFF